MTRISLTSFCIGALLMGSSSLAWGETAMAQISADETVEFDIPEQDLASALTQVGIQSQREIIFADNIARGQTASGLQRRMTPEHAVDVLLAGTGLNARVNRVGAITISAEDQAATSDEPEDGADEPVETTTGLEPTSGVEDAQRLDTVFVTGTRGALENAIDLQRDARGIVSIAASDEIGQFPDENAAEAARRLPGVSTVNNRGEGRFISVRGAEPGLVGVSIDGISLPGQEDDRSVALDVVPSEQLSRVEVYKSLTADQDAEGIGGRINLVTKSPFELDGRVLSLTGSAGWNEQNSDTPYRISGAYADVLGDARRFGIVLSGSFSSNPKGFESVSAGDWEEDEVDGVEGYYPEGITFQDRLFTNDRIGLSATLEWAPDDATHFKFGANFNSVELTEVRERLQFDFEDPENVGPLAGDRVFSSMDTFDHRVRRRFDYVENTRESWNIFARGEHEFGPSTVDYKLSYAVADEDSIGPEISLRTGGFNSSISGMAGGEPTVVQNGGLDWNDPSLFEYHESGARTFDRDDEEYGAELNWTRSIGESEFKTGIKLRSREKVYDTDRIRQGEFLEGDLFMSDPRLLGSPPSQDSRGYDYVLGFDKSATLALLNQLDLFDAEPRSYQDSLLSDFTVTEDIYAAYAQYAWVSGPLEVIPGLRVEQTETEATFYQDFGDDRDVDDPTRYEQLTRSNSYTEFFPSLNIKYGVSEDLVLRGSFNRSLARPGFGKLAAAREIDQEDFLEDPTEPIKISEGNPNLEPSISLNFDAEAAYYFAPGGLVSAGLFYKQIDGPIYTQEYDELYEGHPAEVKRPANAGEAEILGLELSYIHQFTFLPGALEGLGIYSNLTLIDSSVDVPERPGEEFPLFKQSDVLGNLSVTYQKYGIDAQIGLNYRGESLKSVQDPGLDEYTGEYMTVDAKIRYTPNDRIAFFATADNLTDEPEFEYAGDTSRMINNEFYGRNVLFGVEVTFGQ